ncbi:hypothetical protein FB567DRAFT_41343 [Paraphoma chrysanthemicola]|uniref:Uncharacterized protein n=1 Tax=Paraphoma chrysanthemicola TaxID=798071 RepID=A0A8K0W4M0_9PLEO|nr:hypothetical protein FB567DRAFT_41343 [Paraphoma chrysanthemicola]
MKLSTVLYIVGLSSLAAAAPQEDEPELPGFTPRPLPSFSRGPIPSFSRGPLPSVLPPRPSGSGRPPLPSGPAVPPRPSGSGRPPVPSGPALPPRPSGSALPPVVSPPVRPSRTRSFVISVRPTRSVGLPPRPTPGEDEDEE